MNIQVLILVVFAILTCFASVGCHPHEFGSFPSEFLQDHDFSAEHLGYPQAHNITSNCSNFLVEDEYILLQNGNLLLPTTETVYNSYYLWNNTAYICDDHKAATTTEVSSNFSLEFRSCGHVLIEPEEYKLLSNGTVVIELYSKSYGPSDYIIHKAGVFVCVPQYDEMQGNSSSGNSSVFALSKFSISSTYVTYFGMSLSIVSLFSHLVVFCVVSSVKNLPGCCLASLSLSLLVAYVCFLSSDFVDNHDSCAVLGMCVYYFFLSSFFWMNAIAFDVWRSFRIVVRELRISSYRIPWRRFSLYSLYSWMTPAILVVFVKVADSTDLLPLDLKPQFGVSHCWFGQRKSLLLFFATPLFCVMLLNAAFFLDVTFIISRATMKTGQSQHDPTMRKRFFMFMRLALIMGLTWIVGVVAAYVNNEVLWYLFVILNTLQGLFIFIVFSCSSKVRGLFCCRLKKRSKAMSTSVQTISQISATV